MRTPSGTDNAFLGNWPKSSLFCGWSRDPRRIRHITEVGHDALLIHGQCFATDQELRDGFTEYVRTGDPRALIRWPGSYSVLAARGERDLTVVSDLAGQFPVYYAASQGGFSFSSDAGLLGRPSAAAVDRLALGLHLVGLDHPAIAPGRTPLAGVCRVDPEQPVHVDRGGRLTLLDLRIPADPGRSAAEAAEELRPRLLTAVRLRAELAGGDRLSADLSGGVDSTAIAGLAAGFRTRPIAVFTHHNTAAPVESDLDLARDVAALDPRLEQHLVMAGRAEAPFQDLGEALVPDLPDHSLIGFARTRLRLTAAAAHGSVLHLTGDGGDLLASAPPAYLADLALLGRPGALLRHCTAWARLRHRPVIDLVTRARRAAATTPGQALRGLVPQLSATADPAVWEDAIAHWGNPAPTGGWLTARARTELTDFLHARAVDTDFPHDWLVSDFAVRGDLAAGAANLRYTRAVAESLGIELHCPYLDSDILRICLSVTASRRAALSVAKPLLRTALAGLVPDQVLRRATKGDYSRELYIGLRRAETELRALLHAPLSADLGLVEPGPLLAVIDRASAGLPVPWPGLSRFLAAELWLRHHSVPHVVKAEALS